MTILARTLRITAFASLASAAAAEAGSISGRVIDGARSPVPGARASLLTPQQGVVATVQTETDGSFGFRNLAPGRYELVVSLAGFETSRKALRLDDKGLADLLIDLSPGRLAEEVTVTADIGRA
jgi:hypothetical protein